MLSTELTKRKDTCHLQSFLERINAPHIPPKGSPEERKFRQNVVERLEQRRAQVVKLGLSDNTIPSGPSTVGEKPRSFCHRFTDQCCKCGIFKSKSADPEIVWRRLECKTLNTFKIYATAAVNSNLNIIRCLKAISQSLSFWEEPNPNWEGLSVFGCYGWMLSFSLQHLMDEDDQKNPTLLAGLDDIRQLYTEIGQSVEIFVDMVETFYSHSHRLRLDALYAVKKLVKKWKLENQSPLLKRPEHRNIKIREPARRVGTGLLDPSAFQVELNWTPLSVMIKSKRMSLEWQQFGGLILFERLHWFKVFAQKVVDNLEVEAEEMQIIDGQLSFINLSEDVANGSTVYTKAHAREISGAIIHFSKIAKTPSKKSSQDDEGGLLRLLSELWFSADILHDEAYQLVRLIRESRDILRTCYVYADVFYKLNLPSYDNFLTKGPNDAKGLKASQQSNATTIREAWEKFVAKDDGKRLSDISEMLVMSDFSTSNYQRILQVRPVEAEDMIMMLEDHCMDEKQSFGLVSGI